MKKMSEEEMQRRIEFFSRYLWDLTTMMYAKGEIPIHIDVAIKCMMANVDGPEDLDLQRYNEWKKHWADKANKRDRPWKE